VLTSALAKANAQRELTSLGDRWLHTVAVARQAEQVASVLALPDDELLVAAAWLHDIGYAPALAVTGFHPLDGAVYLDRLGHRRLACLVANHTAPRTRPDYAA